MARKRILITGADGYVGGRILQQVIADGTSDALAYVRASTAAQFEEKREKLKKMPASVEIAWGDLRDSDPFKNVAAKGITDIFHCAAVAKFNVTEETAQKVNVEGTEKVFKFALSCPDLEHFSLVSTVYASGLKTGDVSEEPFTDSFGFANHYERSKFLSEQILIQKYNDLPWKIFRLATVICENTSGRVIQYNAFHNTLKLLYYGLLSVVPGNPETPLYFITGDEGAEALFKLRQHPKGYYNVCHSRSESITLQDLIDLVFESFEEDADFVSRRILRPLFSDKEAFGILTKSLGTFSGDVVSQAMSSIAPFGNQLFIQKDIKNENVKNALLPLTTQNARELIKNTCKALIKTKWGRELQ